MARRRLSWWLLKSLRSAKINFGHRKDWYPKICQYGWLSTVGSVIAKGGLVCWNSWAGWKKLKQVSPWLQSGCRTGRPAGGQFPSYCWMWMSLELEVDWRLKAEESWVGLSGRLECRLQTAPPAPASQPCPCRPSRGLLCITTRLTLP